MFNKELFDEICDVHCAWAELEKFVTKIDKNEFDLDNPFDKYYNVDRIICAIEKYQSKEIDAKFLADWMDAYNWIIMGGFKIEDEDKSVSLKDFLIWTITDWIDSLTFFEDSDDYYTLEEYKTVFRVLDFVLKDLENCDAEFSQKGHNEGDVVVLVINRKAKYFIKIWGQLNYAEEDILIPKVPHKQLQNQVNDLKKQGYKELRY